jgi:hypothetical protein
VRAALPPAIEPRDTRGTLVTDAQGQTVRQIVVEDGKPVSTAYFWRGHLYVRADDLFEYFNIRYNWRVSEQMLSVMP